MVFGDCEDCGTVFRSGDTAWTGCVQQETFEEDGTEVHEAEVMLMYCNTCANKKNFKGMTVPTI